MKPAPFEKVEYLDESTHFQLVSTPKSEKQIEETRVFNEKKNLLWSMPTFVGRHQIQLSPDGNFLLLTGDFYFGSALSLSPKAEIAIVYDSGKLKKTISFSELFEQTPEAIAKARKLLVKGGGWARRDDFIKKITVDWKAKNISIELYSHEIKVISF